MAISVKAPKFNLSKADLEKWTNEINGLKLKYTDDSDIVMFKTWLKSQQLKVAPGLDSIITPHKVQRSPTTNEPHDISGTQQGNELDKVFGSLGLK